MPSKISIEGMPEARARLAALPREEVEGICVKALMDAGILAAGLVETARLIGEAKIFLNDSENDAANSCLDEAIAISGNPLTTAGVPS